MENPFQLCDTDFKLFKTLRNKDLICDFEEFSINTELNNVNVRGNVTIGVDEVSGILLPIAFQFKKLFENADLLLKTMKEMQKNSYSFKNFIQGPLWKQKSKIHMQTHKIAIPFYLYIDDCEINNPLGSHKGAITFAYYSFPVLEHSPTHLACLFSGKDYKAFGNQK